LQGSSAKGPGFSLKFWSSTNRAFSSEMRCNGLEHEVYVAMQ
jgi:hypothetical protein